MPILHFRKRHRLRRKEIKKLSQELQGVLGVPAFSDVEIIDMASGPDYDVIFVNNNILGIVINGKTFLTVKGLLKYKPERRYVTVDMGAVLFVYNGADIMVPGIVDADSMIQKGDLVWVRDEKNVQPLAIGRALISGSEMIKTKDGKAIKSLHHVGDDLWKFGEE